jgi:hypothetical protein
VGVKQLHAQPLQRLVIQIFWRHRRAVQLLLELLDLLHRRRRHAARHGWLAAGAGWALVWRDCYPASCACCAGQAQIRGDQTAFTAVAHSSGCALTRATRGGAAEGDVTQTTSFGGINYDDGVMVVCKRSAATQPRSSQISVR